VHILKLCSPSKIPRHVHQKDTLWISWTLKTRRRGYPETSVTNY
jgi:hypothetical protein